jgi:hypothetical protein
MSRKRLITLNTLNASPKTSSAIVLVMGLEVIESDKDTEKKLISRVQMDFKSSSVYKLSYPSRIKKDSSAVDHNATDIATEYAELVKSDLLEKYSSVIIISYCLGGIYTSFMLPKLKLIMNHTLDKPSQLKLIMIDVPHYCTSDTITNWFKKLIDHLRISTQDLLENMAFWKLNVISGRMAFLKDRSYAIVSSKKSWITPMKPAAFLPPSRVFNINEKHENLLVENEGSDWELYPILFNLIKNQTDL